MPHPREEEATRPVSQGGSIPDTAVEGAVKPEDRHIETPYAHKTEPLPEGEKCDQLADKKAHAESDQEALLDEALEETFPSSDPISPKHIT